MYAHISRRHRRARVEATKVYNELISHKSHVHMNGIQFHEFTAVLNNKNLVTKWTTLTEFIKHLGSRPDCTIEETAKGWFVLYQPTEKEDTVRQHMKYKRARENTDEREIEKVRHTYPCFERELSREYRLSHYKLRDVKKTCGVKTCIFRQK